MRIARTLVISLSLAAVAAAAAPVLLPNGVGVVRVDELGPADLLRRGAVPGADAAVVRALSGAGFYALRVEIPAGGEFRPAKMAAESARLIVSGGGAVVHGGRRYEARPGSIAIFPPGASPAVAASQPTVVLLVAPRNGGMTFEPLINLDPLASPPPRGPLGRAPLMSAGSIAVERVSVKGAPAKAFPAEANTILAVLRGSVLLRCGADEAAAEPGAFVRVPAGARCRLSSPGGAELLAISVR